MAGSPYKKLTDVIHLTTEVPPGGAVPGQLGHAGAEGEAEEQPAGQPEGHGVVAAGQCLAEQGGDQDGQESGLQQQIVPRGEGHTHTHTKCSRCVCGSALLSHVAIISNCLPVNASYSG